MRSLGERIFETDLPSGTDMIATLRAELYSKEKFEMEITPRPPTAREGRESYNDIKFIKTIPVEGTEYQVSGLV